MMCEGASTVIEQAIAAGKAPADLTFDGYGDLGIDSFVTRWRNDEGHLRDYTNATLAGYINANTHLRQTTKNEAGDWWITFEDLTLEESAFAVAAIWAWAKEKFVQDVADAAVMGNWTTQADQIPAHVQYFWTTIYFNTKSPRDTLNHRGIGYHDLRWLNEDDHATYSQMEKYNGNWRTATFRLFCATSGL